MNYKSIADLNSDIKKWITELPNNFDIIVGIPRSGLLVANLLALYSNLPIADIDGLCNGRVLSTGFRYGNQKPDLMRPKKILVVDDSINSGKEMRKAKSKIKRAKLPHEIYYGTVYTSPQGQKEVDMWYEIVDMPRVFEWNVMHHDILVNSCVDIDGVLNRDPTSKENDDGEKYWQFLINVQPLIRPTKTIGWLVTCRLEKYRKLTEKWLRKYDIKYNHLVMLNLPNKETRLALGNHTKFKAEVYKSTKAVLFIESSMKQAQDIVRLAGKPVLCTETNEMINPGILVGSYRSGRELISKVMNDPLAASIKLPRFLKVKIDKIKYKIIAKIKKKGLNK